MEGEGETSMAIKIAQEQVTKLAQNGHAQTQGEQVSEDELIEGLISEEGRQVTEDVYWAEYYEHPDFDYEWNNGVLEVKPMSDYVKYSMYEWLVVILREFLQVHPMARKMALEMGFRLTLPGQKVTVRKPDLFVVRNDNPVPLGDLDRTYYGICDLCIESISDSTKKEIERDTVQKKQEYAEFGVREYYILDPSGTHTAFYRLTPTGDYADMDATDGVIRSTVLPDFRFRIADLYRQPQLVELVDDEVYRDFVLLAYQTQRARADDAQEMLAVERTRADRLAARLRALGIDEETE